LGTPTISLLSVCGAQAYATAWMKAAGRFKAAGTGRRKGRTNPRWHQHRLTNQQLVVTSVTFFTRKPSLTAKAQKGNEFPPKLPVAKDFFSSYTVLTCHSVLTSMLGPQV